MERQFSIIETRQTISLSTERVWPPIPIRNLDWQAVDAQTYEPGFPMGTGETEAEAIDSLLDAILN